MIISIYGLIAWAALFNATGALLLVIDKKRARRHMRRIPEKRLLWIGFLGGAPVMLMTMYLIHHKTRHKKFTIGFLIASLVMLAALLYIWNDPEHFTLYWSVFWDEIY